MLECVCGFYHSLTSDRWEVDADQQSEESGNIIDYIRHVDVLCRVTSTSRRQLLVFYQHTQWSIL